MNYSGYFYITKKLLNTELTCGYHAGHGSCLCYKRYENNSLIKMGKQTVFRDDLLMVTVVAVDVEPEKMSDEQLLL